MIVKSVNQWIRAALHRQPPASPTWSCQRFSPANWPSPCRLKRAQRAQFAEKGYFEVVGGDTGKLYRIYAGAATNVCEVDENGRPTLGLCFLPMGDLPTGDVMLSQKIALESSEGHALAVARSFVPDGTFRRSRLLR